jgi:hypothetical protein
MSGHYATLPPARQVRSGEHAVQAATSSDFSNRVQLPVQGVQPPTSRFLVASARREPKRERRFVIHTTLYEFMGEAQWQPVYAN